MDFEIGSKVDLRDLELRGKIIRFSNCSDEIEAMLARMHGNQCLSYEIKKDIVLEKKSKKLLLNINLIKAVVTQKNYETLQPMNSIEYVLYININDEKDIDEFKRNKTFKKLYPIIKEYNYNDSRDGTKKQLETLDYFKPKNIKKKLKKNYSFEEKKKILKRDLGKWKRFYLGDCDTDYNMNYKKIISIAKKFHNLNYFIKHCKKQIDNFNNKKESYFDFLKKENENLSLNYEEKLGILTELGLRKDRGFIYGTGWLFKIIPDDIIKKIKEIVG